MSPLVQNYCDESYRVYFNPIWNGKLLIPQYAVIELTLVNSEGQAVPGVNPITDLVEIDIRDKTLIGKEANLFFESSLEPLNRGENAPGLSGYDSEIGGFEYKKVSSVGDVIDTPLTGRQIKFFPTSPVSGECNEGGKKAFSIKHTHGTQVAFSESLCSKKIFRTSIFYQTKLPDDKIDRCAAGQSDE
ncbi:hypothetical protein RF11_14671 [Thelohanellus kitauei]|uniref:Uncharacterized protein n=1 Tax=Thelohanellus kitauei TaxID=669202 RepID=A0A0C2IFD0_THEKT|nr:hypothetical protein RF11_14671 [Thelohanellus kitauei]